jgi:hypothetical protein
MIQPRYGIALQSLSIQWVDLLEWCHPNPLSSSWKEKVMAYVTLWTFLLPLLTCDQLTTTSYSNPFVLPLSGHLVSLARFSNLYQHVVGNHTGLEVLAFLYETLGQPDNLVGKKALAHRRQHGLWPTVSDGTHRP